MKIKIITIFLIFSFFFNNCAIASSHIDRQIKASKKNVQYSSVKKYNITTDSEQTKSVQTKKKLKIKDPKLIKFKKVKTIPASEYNKKIAQDEVVYKKTILPQLKKKTNSVNVNPLPVDFYNLYRITEKLIRANKLDYVNWRIAVRKTTKDYNASTTSANLIWINTALYDSLYSNPDALAYVIGHEMAHQVLGHQQQMEDRFHRHMIWINSLLIPTLGYGSLLYIAIADKMENKASRTDEYMADALSTEFLVRAGFDPYKALEAINIINAHPHKETINSTHPDPEKRIENVKETVKYLSKDLKNEGKLNVYNSEVLDCKKSSDRVSMVITRPEKQKNDYYKVESPEEILKRIAYVDYKNGDMEKAIKNFKTLAKITESYVPYLYTSYAYEYLYNETNDDKYLKKAKKYAKEANTIKPDDKNVIKQLNALSEDL